MDNRNSHQETPNVTEPKIRSSIKKAKYNHMKFTIGGNSDQSVVASSAAGEKAANKLAKMRKRYGITSSTTPMQPDTQVVSSDLNQQISLLRSEDKQRMYDMKHNMKSEEMEKVRSSLSDAKEILELRNLASAYIKTDVIDRNPQKFLEALREAHDKLAGEVLLRSFEESFPATAKLIRKIPPAMQLVREAGSADVKFAGYAETGPLQISRSYARRDRVYISNAETDPWKTMSAFLVELNNGINAPRILAVQKEISDITDDTFAYKKAAIEVDAMLRVGKIWSEIKEANESSIEQNVYDDHFYFNTYQAYKEGRLTKDNIVQDLLKKYVPQLGMTYEQIFKQQYINAQPRLVDDI